MSFNSNQDRQFSELEKQAIKDYFEKPKSLTDLVKARQISDQARSIAKLNVEKRIESVKAN